MTLEGSGGSQLLQAVRKHGKDTTQPTTLSLATITAMPPNISVIIDGDYDSIPSSAIIVAEHLTTHTRTMRVSGGTTQQYEVQSNLNVGDRVIVAIENDGQLIYVIDKAVI